MKYASASRSDSGIVYHRNGLGLNTIICPKIFWVSVISILFSFPFNLSALDYYWVGGSGNWSDYNTHWATSSGGNVFHGQLPTQDDNVYFDVNSFPAGGTVTIDVQTAQCRDMDWTGATNTPVFSSIVDNTLIIGGSLTLIIGMDWDINGTSVFNPSQQGSYSVNPSAHVFKGTVYFSSFSNVEWTLLAAVKTNLSFSLTGGTLNTNGNELSASDYSFSIGSLFLFNSKVYVTGGYFSVNSSAFVSPGTSQIIFTNPGELFTDGKTLYDVIFESGTNGIVRGTNIEGTLIFNTDQGIYDSYYYQTTVNNLEFNNSGFIITNTFGQIPAPYFGSVTFYSDGNLFGNIDLMNLNLTPRKIYNLQPFYTVSILPGGTLNANGLDCDKYITLLSYFSGQSVDLNTSGANFMLQYVAAMDVSVIGGGSITAENSIDLGGNSGWNFTSPSSRSLYWVGGNGDWSDNNHWSMVSGGTGGACLPTGIDNVYFDHNSGFSGPGEKVNIDGNIAFCNDMIWAGVQNAPEFTSANNQLKLFVFGSLSFDPSMQLNLLAEIHFRSQTNGQTITSAGKIFTNNVYFNGNNGEWTFLDAFTSTGFVFHELGSIHTNGFDLSAFSLTSYGDSLFLYNSNVHISQYLDVGTSFFDAGTSHVFMYNDSYLYSYQDSFYNVTFDGGSIGNIWNSNIIGKLIFNTAEGYYVSLYGESVNEIEFTNYGSIYAGGYLNINTAVFHGDGAIIGNMAFQNLTLTPGKVYQLGYSTEITILPGGILNASGSSCYDHITLTSNYPGNTAFLNTSGIDYTLEYLKVKEIGITGGGTITALNSADLGGNSGWIFNSPPFKNIFWVGGGGNWNDNSHWSLTSGGPGGECIPSSTDNVVFDQNSGFIILGEQVIVDGEYNFCHDMTWQNVQNSPEFTASNYDRKLYIYGSLVLDPGMNLNYIYEIHFSSTHSGNSITTAGKIFQNDLYFDGIGGEWFFADAFNSDKTIYHNTGTLRTNGNDVHVGQLYTKGDSLFMYNSNFFITNFYFNSRVNFLDAGTSNLIFTANGDLDVAHLQTLHNVTFKDNGPGVYDYARRCNISGKLIFENNGVYETVDSNYVNEIEFQKEGTININFGYNGHEPYFKKATFLDNGGIFLVNTFEELIFSPGKTYNLGSSFSQITPFGKFTATGTPGSPITINSYGFGSQAYIYKDGAPICLDYLILSGIHALGSSHKFAGLNSVDLFDNSGWIFDTCPACVLDTPMIAPTLHPTSITSVKSGEQATLILENLQPGYEAVWFDRNILKELYADSLNIFQPVLDSSTILYAAVREIATGCISDLLLVPVCAPYIIVGSNSPVCQDHTLFLSETGGVATNWSWSGPNGFSSIDQNPEKLNITFNDSGFYKVAIIDNYGCSDSSTVYVNVIYFPDVNPTPDAIVCNGYHAGFQFSGSAPGTVFRWKKISANAQGITDIPNSGTGDISLFRADNFFKLILTDSIIVTPVIVVNANDSCVGTADTFLITVIPNVYVTKSPGNNYCFNSVVPTFIFEGDYLGNGVSFTWNRNGAFLGITPLEGIDSIPGWTAVNTGTTVLVNSFFITPFLTYNGVTCPGTTIQSDIYVYPEPLALCKSAEVYLDDQGTVSILPVLINDGSIGSSLSINPTTLTCADLGPSQVVLTASDFCSNSSTCVAIVTVIDTTAPIVVCNDITRTLSSGQCGLKLDFIPNVNDNCPSAVNVRPLDTSLYKFGQLLLIGSHNIGFIATDPNGNTSTCFMNVIVNPIPNPTLSLACISEVQISLNENCEATIGADDILTGGPYRCFDEYKVEVRDWYSNVLIDRNPILDGAQVGKQDIGKQFKVSIKDTVTGNSCWGKVTVEDKLPPMLVCPRDTSVICGRSLTTPDCLGTPSVKENCGDYSLTYYDDILLGNCAAGYQELIRRIWTATDESGNKSTCVHTIRVEFIKLSEVEVPLDYDGFENPTLSCDEKINPSFDFASHLRPYPYCVDGFLLDSTHWFATGGFLPSPAGDLAGERIPRTLGWNCIDTGKYIGHPSPYPVYYPPHPEWNKNNPVCWGPDQVVMWLGTGVPENGKCINISYNFQDLKIDLATPNCDAGSIGCFKILRQWTVLDWCTGQWGGSNQLIKVMDNKGPSIVFPDSVLVTMDDLNCSGKFEVPQPWLTDNCSNDIHYYVTTESGIILGNEIAGYIITSIQRGIWNAYIVAEDCCGNVTRKRFVINGQDLTPPNPVCDKKTVVSLNLNQSGESFAQVFAKDLDQSSFDNCSPHVFFKVIRMEQLRGTIHGAAINQPEVGNCTAVNGDDHPSVNGNQIYFDDYARFCCGDVGKTIRVVLRVFDVEPGEGPINPGRMSNNGDLAGHFNDCMIDIEVQDKTLPTVQAPPDIVVSCWFWFDVEKLDDPNDPTFGRVVTDLGLRKKIIINDLVCHPYCVRNEITGYPGYIPGAPQSNPPAWNRACDFYRVLFDTAHADRKYDMTWGFDGTVLGACGTNFGISVNDARQCGQGRITRTILARGPNATFVTATQTIWIVDCDPFYINRDDDCDPDDDITWPGNCTGAATTIEGCGADISPDNPLLGRPKIENNADDLCSLISTEFFDEIFTIEPDACFKVLRKWVVIDWCQYDPNLSLTNGRWEYLQIIKVHDIDKPVVDISVSNCIPALKRAFENACFGYLEIIADATDNCSPFDWLFYEYKVDLYNDGKGKYSGFDHMVSSLSPKQFAEGKKPYISDNPAAVDPNNPFEATGTYPLGIHKICWYVEDGCGNLSVNCKLFEVEDCKKPTPYCYTGIITTVMPSTKCITIWARDYDIGSFDNCTEAKDLRIYFGANNADSMTICCDDFKANNANDELTFPVVICVEDEEGNFDCCISSILVQDPHDVCPNVGSNARVSGGIQTMMDVSTKNVKVQLLESLAVLKEIVTNNDGDFLFGDLAFGTNKKYVIKPTRTDNPLNGVSTADIVKIQRHILGQENLPTPYQLIAADVNRSSGISAADVSDIRKLVLGITAKFDKTDSWTFVPKNYAMDLQSPWSTPRDLTINASSPQDYKADFVSVKMGDVNNSAIANNLNQFVIRKSGILQFEIDSHTMSAGELYKLEFKSRNFNDISGYQFTLKFDEKILTYEGFESGELNLSDGNFGTQRKNEGYITTSWNTKSSQTVAPNTTIFSLLFRTNADVNIAELLSINNQITAAEAYDEKINVMDVSLAVIYDNQQGETAQFELYQNTPNPFDKETTIHFVLPESMPAQMSIYDVAGKVVWTEDIHGKKGWNSVKIKREAINASGVFYYQLNAREYSSTRRMVVNSD